MATYEKVCQYLQIPAYAMYPLPSPSIIKDNSAMLFRLGYSYDALRRMSSIHRFNLYSFLSSVRLSLPKTRLQYDEMLNTVIKERRGVMFQSSVLVAICVLGTNILRNEMMQNREFKLTRSGVTLRVLSYVLPIYLILSYMKMGPSDQLYKKIDTKYLQTIDLDNPVYRYAYFRMVCNNPQFIHYKRLDNLKTPVEVQEDLKKILPKPNGNNAAEILQKFKEQKDAATIDAEIAKLDPSPEMKDAIDLYCKMIEDPFAYLSEAEQEKHREAKRSQNWKYFNSFF